MTDTIRIETDDRGIATLALARPEKHNAMSAEMIAELTEAAATLGADPGVRAVILAADGATFCAGGDLNWMRAQADATRAQRIAEAKKLAGMLRALDTLPKPLIGRIHGNAFGGGVGLACVCDMTIGTDAVRMGLTETRLGLIPATIGPYVAARVGPARARAVFMSGQRFGADEALRLGLLSHCVEADALEFTVRDAAEAYRDCAPGAVAAAKALLRSFAPPIDDAVLDRTANALADQWETDEAAEGIAAFFGKRAPAWTD
ncbi:crotonase/enoyl-CoA hydratase family protein [Psychromarinibacter sp. C21-152]|uniref:Crotonase/enoyl-CoA hydratase family protein n=1 Tax=Psychromarinibacter sediminicola TaxID=3033385 RepID=A0AAE3T7S2_9RHOB|nr:crotonase/enoyl-CoA hydratase family protein [Psychromarinibacter sediminicola]MDF0600620.1 crotonase/enoyl-CoA hydratase family protein [Psychromarinibacter sediminicola]